MCVRVTVLSGIYYSGPSWQQSNFLPDITADSTGHSKFPQCHTDYRFEKMNLRNFAKAGERTRDL